ncbi:TPA: SdpA family antimicrobial peptide system protein [Staphylococcus aureus]|nr:SdpA family antimicrobial peptide system protein [Staphylococcus aureus]HCW3607138.1 SdpA family antimicrobial peptide system protein [Staphylococcus aureus]
MNDVYKKITIFLITIIISTVFLLFTVINSLGHTIVSPNQNIQYYLKILMPQEWGFYSKNPKTLDLTYVEVDGNKIIQPNAHVKTLWGLNREARAQGTEAGLIYQEASKRNLIKTTESYYDDFVKETKNEPFVKIKNPDSRKKFKGKYIFYSGEIIPFSWAKNTKERHIVKKYVKVDVQ